MTNLIHTSGFRLDVLRRLKEETQHVRLLTGKFLQGRLGQVVEELSQSTYSYPIPTLDLPLPENVAQILDDLSLPPPLLSALDHKYRLSLEKMQHIHRDSYEQACRQLCSLPQADSARPLPIVMDELRKVYETTYVTVHLPMMKNEILSIRSKYTPTIAPKKAPFNAEYTPLLEKYFQFNAYPSAPDRQVLAQKTTMSPRQIEVWFQNHRKRAKESGKVIKRMAPNIYHNILPSSQRIGSAISTLVKDNPSKSLASLDDPHDDRPSAISVSTADTLDRSHFPPLSCAFPNRFSPSTSIYHFLQNDTNFTFSPPTWIRRASSQAISRSDINMEEFISVFAAKLNVRVHDGAAKSRRRTLFRSCTDTPWFFATTTTPSCAPHPALIRPSTPLPQPFNASDSTPLPLTSPQPPAVSYSLPLAKEQTRSNKKVPPFPKRYPSKYHPYSILATAPHRSARVHSLEPTAPFGSGTSYINPMPSRTINSVVDSTSPPVTWVANLEANIPPSRTVAFDPSSNRVTTPEAVPISASQATLQHLPSASTSLSGSRVTSFDSNSTFGSRTSSLSSIQSSLPTSPPLQPQSDGDFTVDHQDLQFLSDITDFDQLLTGNTQLSFAEDMFSPKPDGMFGYALPYLQSTLASFPMNFIHALS